MSTERKLNLIHSIQYSANFELISSTLLKWNKENKTDEVSAMIKALTENFFYTHNLEVKQDTIEHVISEYRMDKNRAVTRARKAEQRLAELEKKIESYKAVLGE